MLIHAIKFIIEGSIMLAVLVIMGIGVLVSIIMLLFQNPDNKMDGYRDLDDDL